jgi:hypothetical protein
MLDNIDIALSHHLSEIKSSHDLDTLVTKVIVEAWSIHKSIF